MDAATTLGSILAEVLSAKVEPVGELEAQALAGWSLARHLSNAASISADDAYAGLCQVPDNMLSLLETPQGWTALASVVAADNGLPEPSFIPTIH